ncbi:unnamed protein product [Protopolystoma xenopodis]|uniref:Uncharacterized protein n=1 Tax=Protopolystoma xenopodis TaxID=117903 RepID=A0A3S5FBR3_9PLAT|nr:unnamed protein product [Protopolystoma xenopodis]
MSIPRFFSAPPLHHLAYEFFDNPCLRVPIYISLPPHPQALSRLRTDRRLWYSLDEDMQSLKVYRSEKEASLGSSNALERINLKDLVIRMDDPELNQFILICQGNLVQSLYLISLANSSFGLSISSISGLDMSARPLSGHEERGRDLLPIRLKVFSHLKRLAVSAKFNPHCRLQRDSNPGCMKDNFFPIFLGSRNRQPIQHTRWALILYSLGGAVGRLSGDLRPLQH